MKKIVLDQNHAQHQRNRYDREMSGKLDCSAQLFSFFI
jgi:hypothetical protein